MDTSSINFLPDEALIHASQNGAPGIPAWLATSQLAVRNQQRASAPVQAPQGTVAQSVVQDALKSLGMTPGMPQQSPTNTPQSTGIMGGSQPATFAKGGAVKFASGGIANGIDGLLENSGLIPKSQTITSTPTQYNPAITPDTGDLESAAARVGKLYGQEPDYAGQQARIDANAAKGQQKYGVGSWLTDMVAGILGGKSISPTENFGSALGNADNKQRAVQQQNFENSNTAERLKSEVENRQFSRQKAIVQSAESYHSLNVQMADSQAREKAANDAGNARAAQEAAEKTAELASQRSTHLANAAKLFSDPGQAQVIGRMALASGNKGLAQFASDAADVANAQAKKESDIKQADQMALEGARSRNAMGLMQARESISHRNKMEEMGMAADGDVSNMDPSAVAKGIANYTIHPLSPMSLSRPQAQAIMKQVKDINPDWNGTYYDPIQAARKDANPGGKTGSGVLANNTAINHLDLLSRYAEALDNGDQQTINSLKNKVSSEFGGTAPGNFDAVKAQVAGELVAMLKKNGLPDQAAQQEAEKHLDKAKSYKQLQGVIDGQIQIGAGKLQQLRSQTRQMPGIKDDDPIFNQLGYTPESKAILYHRGFDPDDPTKGKTLAGLPGGFGKPIDHDTAVKFIKAAGNDTEKGKKIAYDFGWR